MPCSADMRGTNAIRMSPQASSTTASMRGAIGRPNQLHAVEDVLDHLRVDLDAGHELAQGRGLEVEHAQAVDADEHHLVLELVGIHLAVHHLVGDHEARIVVAAEAQPGGAALPASRSACRPFAAAAARRCAARCAIPRRGPRAASPRPATARACPGRSPPAAPARITWSTGPEFIRPRPSAAPSISVVAADVADERAQRRLHAGRHHDGRAARRLRKAPVAHFLALDAEHHVAAADRVGEDLVVGRHRLQRALHGLGQHRQLRGDRRGREAVRIGEDRCRSRWRPACTPAMRVDQFGHARARPRPLAEAAQVLLVDPHDGHRVGGALEREDALVAVEDRRRAGAARSGDIAMNSESAARKHQGEDAKSAQRVQRSISRPS